MTLAATRVPQNEQRGFFSQSLQNADPDIFAAIGEEAKRQQDHIELIASENMTSLAVIQAQGSVLTNKYAEGYPGKRYYGGCYAVDRVETLAIERAKTLFGAGFANVQPHSGAQANGAVFLALLNPGDTVLGMGLEFGGHLSHGAKVNMSGKWFNIVSYGVRESDGLIDYDAVEALALQNKPKLIIAGGSAYSRVVDFARFRQIADKVGAYFMVDMAHFAGLVAGGVYPSPVPFADVTTTTTHKTLRGPRGGMILTNKEDLAKKFNSAVFPGMQGGPLMHVIAGKAVCFGEALQPSFKQYAQNVLDNARALAEVLVSRGCAVIAGGTDSHLVLVDLRPKGVSGKDAAETLELAHMTCNKNAIPYDPAKPAITSGIRLGTPAGTTRGFGVKEFQSIGHWVGDILDAMATQNAETLETVLNKTRRDVAALTAQFPVYPD
ncbi:MAG: serine hydroxymethyltransferase [bacterium]|jgi:glycine hydroxymethyltransferase